MTQRAPYGSWPSPLSPAVMGGARVSLTGLQVVGDTCWWSESRPHEGGRMAVMRLRRGGAPEEVSPPGVSVRSRVHEYGGGAHVAEGDGLLYTDLADQALWWLDRGADPVPLTPPAPAGETHRYADARPVAGGRFLVAVRERHHAGSDDAVVVHDELVAVDRLGRIAPTVLVAGRDFFAAPRPSTDGGRLAWVAWDHPDMPWDGSEIWVADLDLPGAAADAGQVPRLRHPTLVAGGPSESVGQPTWAGEDLWFVSDRFGWWQPFVWQEGEAPRRVTTEEVEFHGPDWTLGQATFDVRGDGQLVCRFRRAGRDRLGLLDPVATTLRELDQPCVTISAVRCGPGDVDADGEILVAGSPATAPPAIYRVAPGGGCEELYRATASPSNRRGSRLRRSSPSKPPPGFRSACSSLLPTPRGGPVLRGPHPPWSSSSTVGRRRRPNRDSIRGSSCGPPGAWPSPSWTTGVPPGTDGPSAGSSTVPGARPTSRTAGTRRPSWPSPGWSTAPAW